MASRARTCGRFTHCFTVFAVATAALSATLPDRVLAADAPPKDPTGRAEWLSNEAAAAFDDSRYLDAIRLYLDAWEAVPSAAILYNVAFIYDRRLGDAELAITYYERVVAAADADASLVEKARGRLVALKSPPPEKETPPPKDPVSPEEKDPATPPEKVIGRVTEHLTDPVNPGVSQAQPAKASILPWVVTGAGGALFLGGLATGFVALGTHGDFEAARDAGTRNALQDDGETQAIVADVLMGAGLLAVGTGIIWALIDAPPAPHGGTVTPASAWHVAPFVARDGLGLSVGGHL